MDLYEHGQVMIAVMPDVGLHDLTGMHSDSQIVDPRRRQSAVALTERPHDEKRVGNLHARFGKRVGEVCRPQRAADPIGAKPLHLSRNDQCVRGALREKLSQRFAVGGLPRRVAWNEFLRGAAQ